MCRRMRFIANSNIAMADLFRLHRERIQSAEYEQRGVSEFEETWMFSLLRVVYGYCFSLSHVHVVWILFQSVTCTCSS